jgi:hypothetical protein
MIDESTALKTLPDKPKSDMRRYTRVNLRLDDSISGELGQTVTFCACFACREGLQRLWSANHQSPMPGSRAHLLPELTGSASAKVLCENIPDFVSCPYGSGDRCENHFAGGSGAGAANVSAFT